MMAFFFTMSRVGLRRDRRLEVRHVEGAQALCTDRKASVRFFEMCRQQ